MRCVIFSIVLLSLLFSACSQNRNPCVIKVGDVCIEKPTFRDRLERFAEESLISSEDVLDQMKSVIVDNIVEEQLILQYARKGYITVTEQEIDIAMKGIMEGTDKEDLEALLTEESRNLDDMREFIRTRSIINRTVEKAVKKEIAVSPEKIKKYYEEHESEFFRPSSVELYHVFVKDNYKAKEALVMLRSGVSLEQVVERYSDSQEDERSGFMGVFVKGDLPKEVEDVVFSIPEKRYSEIIDTLRGYHIFYVAKRSKPGTLPLIDAADEIRYKLAEKIFEENYARFIEDLKKECIVEVNWDEIKSVSVKE
ncbi:MAG: peptidyl-prolyl cis-trans isomerase [Deltaproteobacteria bacterium]|nr:peptidyl-prolyl cis-trans isomerase [Deltaproteobacteria bacterium]